jgi:hypothetical protein
MADANAMRVAARGACLMPVSEALSDRSMTRMRVAGLALFLVVFAYYMWDTLHWPMIWDTPIMHYVRFLITRGFKPYSQITDINLPGCYLTEGWGMAVFGWSDLSWRVYEFFLMAILAGSGAVIGGRRNWFAGIFATTFFLVMHASEGPRVATERDELMAILLVAATAMTLLALRRRAALWMLPMGFVCALATSLKPGALLMELGLVALLVWELRKSDAAVRKYIWWMIAGNAVVTAIVVEFLWKKHAFAPLWFIMTKIVPAYAKMVRPGTGYLLRHLLPMAIVPLMLAGLVALLERRGRMGVVRWMLWMGAVVGSISYFMQGKGLTYHRYMAVIFVLLWVGWELCEAMHRENAGSRWTAIVGVAVLFLVVMPYYVSLTIHRPRAAKALSPMPFQLQDDLAQLGGDQLQRQVLCLDMIDGCFDALYRMRLVQNTGATGDMMLFAKRRDFAADYYRQWFWDHDRENPANVVVLVNEWYQNNEIPSFDKVNAWPQYAAYLQKDYVRVVERHFGDAVGSPAYRIYLRKGSAVLQREEADPLR